MRSISKRARLLCRDYLDDGESPLYYLLKTVLLIVAVIVGLIGCWCVGFMFIFLLGEPPLNNGATFLLGLLIVAFIGMVIGVIRYFCQNPKDCCGITGVFVFTIGGTALFVLLGLGIFILINQYLITIPLHDNGTNSTVVCDSFSDIHETCVFAGGFFILLTTFIISMIGLCCHFIWVDYNRRLRHVNHLMV